MRRNAIPGNPVHVSSCPEWVKIDPKAAEAILETPGPIEGHGDIVILAAHLEHPDSDWAWWVREDGVIRFSDAGGLVPEQELRSSVFEATEDIQDGETIYINQNNVLFYFYQRKRWD